jgi:hypothetical protein
MDSSHLRGDDDVFALLEQMGGGGGDASSSTENDKDSAVHNYRKNNFTMPSNLEQAFQLSPPSSPDIEIIRHRNHEKFKSHFYDLFRNCVPSSSDASPTPPSSKLETPNAQRNQCIRSLIHPIWRQMPAHSVWERFQFSVKTLEADCVRDNQRKMGQPTPWCAVDNEEQMINHLLSPSAHQIYDWIQYGKQRGILWEPLLPVPSISSQDVNGENNQRYRRKTFSLLEEEVKFQFIRSFKKCVGGGSKETLPSLDRVYSSLIKLQADSSTDATEMEGVVMGMQNEKQNFILHSIFSSQPFKKVIQKLHKKMMYLAEETYAHFLSDMKKCSDRKAAEDQQRMNVNRKRKRSKDKSGNSPKITFIDQADDDYATTADANIDSVPQQAKVTFGGISLKINVDHLQKLERLHSNTLSNILGSHKTTSSFSHLVFSLLLRYDALEGAGLQSAIPQSVFRFLQSKFGCEFESFASPFNCYEMNQSGAFNFGTAFGDTDAWFGSEGTFFGLDFSKGGCFQANPPFASEFIESMYQRMHHLLSMSKDDESADNDNEEMPPIQFVIFVPSWAESAGWQSLVSSPYLSKHCLIDQKNHYYAEGTQHRRSRRSVKGSNEKDKDNGMKGSYRIASFDTSVFFLQNAAAKAIWKLGEVQDGLEKAFALQEEPQEEKVPAMKRKKKNKKTMSSQVSTTETIIRTSQATAQKDTQRKPDKKKRKKEKSSGKKKALVSGGDDEMNIFNSLGLFDGK